MAGGNGAEGQGAPRSLPRGSRAAPAGLLPPGSPHPRGRRPLAARLRGWRRALTAGGGSSLQRKEQKAQPEKEASRSRIPRLVLRPQYQHQHQKVSPASESPFSEEESREFNPPSSSGGSARTVSSNSFCSGTGAPAAGRGEPPPPPIPRRNPLAVPRVRQVPAGAPGVAHKGSEGSAVHCQWVCCRRVVA